jgi:hypothetical protein
MRRDGELDRSVETGLTTADESARKEAEHFRELAEEAGLLMRIERP